ncbi:class I SAM-dependent methyltransferase [Mycobacterium sp. MAA66]|uniref:class I SAM-dependent methyltransferase n=1 Tax=Mycobacterium sp. MAA66 TaxID=3156297 RepID=UPI00351247B8
MVRSVDDSWDIVTSVGATALAVAAMRAIEARKPDAIARDEYAQHFVAATAGQAPIFTEMLGDPAIAAENDVVVFSSYLGARTRYFDEFFAAAGTAGIRQAVILAAGLDVRGYRLEWPAGTTLYELDLPKVLQFKGDVLGQHGITPNTTVRTLAVDLRDDWPAALIEAGFDRTQPTAWLAEGLLPFLPGAAQDLLFQRVMDLSAPGSCFAVEDFAPLGGGASQMGAAMTEGGAVHRMFASFTDGSADPSALWFGDERADTVEWLRQHGWAISTVTARELLVRYGHTRDDDLTDQMGRSRYFTAVL